MHEYNHTPHSLYEAVSVGLETETVISVLNKLSNTKLPKEMIKFIHDSTANYGKVKLVLKKNRYFVESPFPEVLKTLLRDDAISRARIISEMSNEMDGDYEAKSVEMRSISFHGDGEDNITEISAEMVAVVHSPKQLPFEFRVLEACIETACSSLESETSTLEEEAYPALDELTSQLSTLNLERVRQIKSRLVALSGRVHKSANGDGFTISKAAGEIEGTHGELLNEAEVAAVAGEKEAHSFEIDPSQIFYTLRLHDAFSNHGSEGCFSFIPFF